MNKQILLVLAFFALASCTTLTSRFHKQADFTKSSLLGFYFPTSQPTEKFSLNGVNLVGTFTENDRVIYNHGQLVAPRKSIDGQVQIYGPKVLSVNDVRISISGTPAEILAVQEEGRGFIVTYQSTTYKESRVSVEIQINSAIWSFRGFVLEAEFCGVYCKDCANNSNVCTACPRNSTLVNGKCICNAGYSATGIAPLACEATDEDTLYPNLCYLEHILYLTNNDIRTRIVKENGSYFMVGALAGFKMPTSSCFSNNDNYLIKIQTCFTYATQEDDCTTYQAQWQPDGLTYKIKLNDVDLKVAAHSTKGVSQIIDGTDFPGTEYLFNVDVRFASKFDWQLDCADENCTAEWIREHNFKLRLTKFVDLKLENLVFITENVQTAEDCGCPFNEFIKGTAYIYEEITCENKKANPQFVIGSPVYVGVEMNDHTMLGNINIESLKLECMNQDMKKIYLSQTVVGRSWEQSWKTCAATQAIKLDRDSLCKTCQSNLKVIINYYPAGKLNKRDFLSQSKDSVADDVQQTTISIDKMAIVFPEDLIDE